MDQGTPALSGSGKIDQAAAMVEQGKVRHQPAGLQAGRKPARVGMAEQHTGRCGGGVYGHSPNKHTLGIVQVGV